MSAAKPIHQRTQPQFCEHADAFPPRSPRVRLAQSLRRLVKYSGWQALTGLLDRIGLTPHTVQVLCIDRAADAGRGRVLLLRTREYVRGHCPVQGLCAGLHRNPLRLGWNPDPRRDARRELAEEAIPDPPGLERFRLVARYREGRYRQFACSVFVVDCSLDEFQLRGAGGEGTPCWARIDDALNWLANPVLAPILLPTAPTGPDRPNPESQ